MFNFARLAFILLQALAACALDLGQLVPQGYVSDYANVIPRAQRDALERYCTAIEQQTGAQMAIVTLPTLEGEPVEDVANALYRRWGIGKKGKDEGLLLLLVVNDRRSRLEVGYGLEPILPDGSAGDVLREMRPALREAAYGDALIAASKLLGTRIAQGKQITLADDAAPRPQKQRKSERAIPLWLMIVGGLFLLFLIGSGNSGMAWMLGSVLMNRGGGRGGGGFGGYDSGGGGFGGFGGGDSGGGGASSDW
jgi:uncharacterized protein